MGHDHFEPFDQAGPWYGFAEGGGSGLAPFAPDRQAAPVILFEEFHGVAAVTVVAEVAKTLTERSPLWILKPPPAPVAETPDAATVRAALARLTKAAGAPPPAGHNQGPPLVDHVPAAKIAEGVRQVEASLVATEVEGKRSPVVAATLAAGKHMLAGALRQVGQELTKRFLADPGHYLSVLHRALVDVLTLLGKCWTGM